MSLINFANIRIKHYCITFLMFANQLRYSIQELCSLLFQNSMKKFYLQAPMAVIGLTCRMDAISLFEKRVRSRFSHRQIYLLCKPNIDNFQKIFQNTLTIQPSRGLKPMYVRSWNKSIEDVVNEPIVQGTLRKLFYMNARPRLLHNVLVSR